MPPRIPTVSEVSAVNEHDREHHWQRQSSLPSSLIPHLLSGLQQSGYSQTRPTLVPPTIHPRNGPHPVSPTLFDHHHQQFPPFNLILADTCPRCLDRGQPDVLSRLAKPFCCDFDPHLPPISPEHYGNPMRSSVTQTSTCPSTSSSGTQTHYCSDELPPSYESHNVEALHWLGSHSNDVLGSNGDKSIQRVKKRQSDSVDTAGNAKPLTKLRKTAIACDFCRSQSFVMNN
jgi:hypothetical protein